MAQEVFLKDIWPTNQEVAAMVLSSVTAGMFRERYADVFLGDERWQAIKVEGGATYRWNPSSTYVQNPPYFEGMTMTPSPVQRHPRRPAAGDLRRFDHHRPHLAGRQHQGSLARGPLPVRAPGDARRVQLLWRPPRQP